MYKRRYKNVLKASCIYWFLYLTKHGRMSTRDVFKMFFTCVQLLKITMKFISLVLFKSNLPGLSHIPHLKRIIKIDLYQEYATVNIWFILLHFLSFFLEGSFFNSFYHIQCFCLFIIRNQKITNSLVYKSK